MDEKQRNHLMIALLAVTALFFITTLGSCTHALTQKKMKDKEIVTRMDLEEKLSTYVKQGESLGENLKATQQALEEEKAAHEATKKAFVQEQLINKSLKDDLQKLSKLKEALEQDLKKIIATGKTDISKK